MWPLDIDKKINDFLISFSTTTFLALITSIIFQLKIPLPVDIVLIAVYTLPLLLGIVALRKLSENSPNARRYIRSFFLFFLPALIALDVVLRWLPVEPTIGTDTAYIIPALLIFSSVVLLECMIRSISPEKIAHRNSLLPAKAAILPNTIITLVSKFDTISVAIFLLFVTIRIGLPLIRNGSFIDEYFQIGSAMELVEHGKLATFYADSLYARGLHVSVLAAVIIRFFGAGMIGLKLIPATVGILNFILLNRILKRSEMARMYKNTVLLVYTISPWTIFNSFYIRGNILNEFFFLMFLLLFIRIIQDSRHKILDYGLLVSALAFNAFTDRGGGLNLLLFNVAIFALYYILFLKLKNIKLLTASLISLLIASAWYVAKTNLIKYGAPTDHNYIRFFFIENAPLTSFFVLCVLQTKQHQKMLPLVVFGFVTFTFSLLIPDSLQIIRGLFYFLPLYFIVSIHGLSRLNFTRWRSLIVCGLIVLSTLASYPKSFISTPYIPDEINYIDNNAFIDAKLLCKNRLVITSSRPRILKFYEIKADFQINSKLADAEWIKNDEEASLFSYNPINFRFYDNDTKTPVITNLKELEASLPTGKTACYIQGGLPLSWVSNEMNSYIRLNFQEVEHSYLSNYDYRKMRLFFKD